MDKIVQTIEKNDKAFVNNRTQNRKENSFVKKNIKAKMKTIISSLPEEQRLIITLYFYEKLSATDIGRLLRSNENKISKILNETLTLINKKAFLEN